MLTTKKRGCLLQSILGVTAALLLVGCMPAGPRAVLDGDKLLQQGKYAEAIARFNDAIPALTQDSQKARTWNRLGLAYQLSGDATKSAQAYQQAIKLDQDLIEARYNLGCLQLEQGNAAAAIDLLTTYSMRQPADPQGFLKLAEAQVRRALQVSNTRDRSQLLASAKKNVEQSANQQRSAEGQNLLGMIAFAKGQSAEAVKLFQTALQSNPAFAAPLLNLAIVHNSSRDPNERRLALKYYRDYLATNPSNATDIDVIARRLEAETGSGGRTISNPPPATNRVEAPRPSDTTSTQHSRYRYLSPSRPIAGNRTEANRWFTAALDAQKAKRLDDAVSNYQKAILADPAFFEAHYNLELVEFERGNLPSALKEAELALSLTSGSVNARYNFALALNQAGYAQDAVNELEKIISQSPAETRAHLLLGSLYAQKLNDSNKARLHFMKVLEIEPQHAQASAIRKWLAANSQNSRP